MKQVVSGASRFRAAAILALGSSQDPRFWILLVSCFAGMAVDRLSPASSRRPALALTASPPSLGTRASFSFVLAVLDSRVMLRYIRSMKRAYEVRTMDQGDMAVSITLFSRGTRRLTALDFAVQRVSRVGGSAAVFYCGKQIFSVHEDGASICIGNIPVLPETA